MPPAMLIVNPTSGRRTPEARAEALEALRTRFRLEEVTTTARDSAISIAREAAESGVPLVIALGGDGHVNEVVNGIAGTPSALGIVPGGTMNVFARSLGMPLDHHAAIERLLVSLDRPARTVPLGKMDDRYFTFAAGCGFDAEAAELVERDLPAKRRFGEMFFYWSALRVLATTYRHRKPNLIASGSFGQVPVSMAIACNSGPYAYFAGLPIDVAPQVSLEGGLDVFALRTMRIEALPIYAWRCVFSRDLVHHRDAFYESDLQGFEITSEEPFKRHVDGEPVESASSARFSVEPNILRVRC